VRPSHKLKNNNELALKETVSNMYYIQLAQDRVQWQGLVNTAINLEVPQMAGNLLTSSVIYQSPKHSLGPCCNLFS
jgi:hypothetical protein